MDLPLQTNAGKAVYKYRERQWIYLGPISMLFGRGYLFCILFYVHVRRGPAVVGSYPSSRTFQILVFNPDV